MKIHYLSENTPSGALVSMDYGGPSCVMVTQMLLSVTDVEPRERHGVTLTKNMHNQADDLTAERAAAIKLYEKVLSYSPDPEAMAAGDDKDFEAILQALKTTRQEALREAASVVNDYNCRHDHGKKATKACDDIFDALERLASEGGG